MSDKCYTSCGFFGLFGKKTAGDEFFEEALGIRKDMVNKLVLDEACRTLGTDETKCLSLDYCMVENSVCKGVVVTQDEKKDFYDDFCQNFEKDTCPVNQHGDNTPVCKISINDECVNINYVDPPASYAPVSSPAVVDAPIA